MMIGKKFEYIGIGIAFCAVSSELASAQTHQQRYETYRSIMRQVEARNPQANRYIDEDTRDLIEQRARERARDRDIAEAKARGGRNVGPHGGKYVDETLVCAGTGRAPPC